MIAVILSSITTTVIGQPIGILRAMREQQAIAMNGGRYAAFRQMSEEQLSELKKDSRLCHVGPTISLGTVDVTDQVTLNLVEYGDHSLDEYPAISQIQEGRLPKKAMEIALSEKMQMDEMDIFYNRYYLEACGIRSDSHGDSLAEDCGNLYCGKYGLNKQFMKCKNRIVNIQEGIK